MKPSVMAMDDYDVPQLISEPLVVFVAATSGQGEAPPNMQKFWRFLLRKNLPRTSLVNLTYAVFGLGDSSYPKFNYAAKKLNKRILQLGGKVLLGIGLADDQHPLGVDGALDGWLETLWTNVLARHPIAAGKPILPSTQLAPPKFHVAVVPAQQADTNRDTDTAECEAEVAAAGAAVPVAPPDVGSRRYPYGPAMPFMASLLENHRLTSPDHFQDVRHLRFGLDGSGLQYSSGDVLHVMPQNSDEAVARMAGLLGVDLADCLQLTPLDEDNPLPLFFRKNGQPVRRTIRDVLKAYLDIEAVPRRYFFEVLSHFSPDPREVERLRELWSTQGQDDLLSYCNRVKRTSAEAIRDFPNLAGGAIKIEYLFDLFRPIAARAFSISSAQQMSPTSVDVTVAIVKYKTRMAVERIGLCTSWFTMLTPESAGPIPVWVTPGTFRVPPARVPLIMIGPGTGMAPFRSMIQDRIATQSAEGLFVAATSPLNVLFFGNRNVAGDFLHGEELLGHAASNQLRLFTAFSRDQDAKIYVQHRIVEHGEVVWNLLSNHGAVCLVAGNSKRMPIDVMDAIKDVAKQFGSMPEGDVEGFIATLERTKKLQFETWS